MGAFIERARMLLANETTVSGLIGVQKATCNLGCKMGRCNGQDCGKCPILQQYLLQVDAIRELHPENIWFNTVDGVEYNAEDVVLNPSETSAETELLQAMVDALSSSNSIDDYRRYAHVLKERNVREENYNHFAEWFISSIADTMVPADSLYFLSGENIVFYQQTSDETYKRTIWNWNTDMKSIDIVEASELDAFNIE